MAKKNSHISRREFFGKSTAGLLGTGLGIPFLQLKNQTGQKNPIICRTLGNTGLKIPVVSFGIMNSDNPDLLRKALDMGISHLDTAHLYLRGNSETFIGKTLEETGYRDKVIIATKMRFARDREKGVFLNEGNAREPGVSEENLHKQLELSLKRLRTDYIDILYIHSCYTPAMTTHETLMNAFVKLKKAGKTRFIGISTHSNEPDVIRAAVDTGIYDVVLTAYNYLQDHKNEVKNAIQYAADKGVGIIAMKTHGGNDLNRDPNVTINHKAALKWVLGDKNVCTTIPGMTTFDQMDLNMSVMEDLTLTEDEKKDLKMGAKLIAPLICQNCRNCILTCPQKVEIPTLMRVFMYAEGYGNLVHANITSRQLTDGEGLEACRSCNSCQAACSRGIDISQRLSRIIEMDIDRV